MEIYRKNDLKWFKVSKRGFREPQNCWFLVSVPEKLSSSSFWMVKTMSKTVAKSRKHLPLRHLILQLLQDVGHLSSQGWRVPTSSFRFSCWNALWPLIRFGPPISGRIMELHHMIILGRWRRWMRLVQFSQTNPFLYPSYIILYLLVSYNYSQKT